MSEILTPPFEEFPKIARLRRSCVITEKLDGTNAQLYITEDNILFAGSRNRWLTLEADNFGFAKWAHEHETELLTLGPGRHYGEWWGKGIQRGYGLAEKRFSLFNVLRWTQPSAVLPVCVSVVPLLYHGVFADAAVDLAMDQLLRDGSVAAPWYTNPEGVVVYHTASRTLYKRTLDRDDLPKGVVEV